MVESSKLDIVVTRRSAAIDMQTQSAEAGLRQRPQPAQGEVVPAADHNLRERPARKRIRRRADRVIRSVDRPTSSVVPLRHQATPVAIPLARHLQLQRRARHRRIVRNRRRIEANQRRVNVET